MCQNLYLEDSDAFFNMRQTFWEQSRNKTLAEKEKHQFPSDKSTHKDQSQPPRTEGEGSG